MQVWAWQPGRLRVLLWCRLDWAFLKQLSELTFTLNVWVVLKLIYFYRWYGVQACAEWNAPSMKAMFKLQLATVTVTLEMPLSYSLCGLQKCYFKPWKLKVSVVASFSAVYFLKQFIVSPRGAPTSGKCWLVKGCNAKKNKECSHSLIPHNP